MADRPIICIDLGTTNTRMWLVHDGQILAREQAPIGVRDSAREGSSDRLRKTLRELISNIRSEHPNVMAIVAAGMITSSLGLVDVPHIPAPAAVANLAAAMKRYEFPDVTDLPVLLVPGVRTGPLHRSAATVAQTDLMRGEETLCIGLIALGTIQPPAMLLNLGSHWKTIQLDAQGRIVGSVTSLSGEMIHATQTSTILAAALPSERPGSLDETWLRAGMDEERRSGLMRTLFLVRLLQLGGDCTPAQRYAYVVGTFIAAEIDALRKAGLIQNDRLVLAGNAALVGAWSDALGQGNVICLSDEQVEQAMLRGLVELVHASKLLHRETGC